MNGYMGSGFQSMGGIIGSCRSVFRSVNGQVIGIVEGVHRSIGRFDDDHLRCCVHLLHRSIHCAHHVLRHQTQGAGACQDS
jgi:hypothetical protein